MDINVDVYEIYRKVGEFFFTQLSATGLITTQCHLVILVYVEGFKINHRQEIVSYKLQGVAQSLVVEI